MTDTVVPRVTNTVLQRVGRLLSEVPDPLIQQLARRLLGDAEPATETRRTPRALRAAPDPPSSGKLARRPRDEIARVEQEARKEIARLEQTARDWVERERDALERMLARLPEFAAAYLAGLGGRHAEATTEGLRQYLEGALAAVRWILHEADWPASQVLSHVDVQHWQREKATRYWRCPFVDCGWSFPHPQDATAGLQSFLQAIDNHTHLQHGQGAVRASV